ncbi:MAG: Methionine aminopeptidase [Candidatus Roizmanbacteria bacterium GW2011_GWA2_35_8]|uniref:Methionine aminopeptidase n=1 Tax=Candidatus Roizmanbacteria bacterium GW2011_GWA2_35_8 TaxID=1618479 RepID=A0A0G0G4L0_9BACT|nr:MAG: Methionine aminopeptidase [Candidatus Roizmanbacteria bacterium GW2011_GWA2_35_8]
MINYKSEDAIEIMRQGGAKLKKVVSALDALLKPGVTTLEIDTYALTLIKSEGGESSFNKVSGYDFSTCLPINEQIVHTRPSNRVLKNGDVFTLDIGMYYKGLHTDFAKTIIIGDSVNDKVKKFLEVGKLTLEKSISKAKSGNRLGDISKIIETEIYKNGYFIIKELTGHGIGKSLHEEPFVFGYLEKPIEKTLLIKPGLTIAIEVIYAMGTEKMKHEPGDDWSIITNDSSLSACFEHTLAVTNSGTLILT